MTILQDTGRPRRTTWLRAVIVAWAVLVSTGVVLGHIALTHLRQQASSTQPTTRIAALESRLAELTRQIDQERQSPTALPLARYETEQQPLHQRLTTVEHALGERLGTDSLAPLQERLERLEARLAAKPVPAVAPRQRAPASPTPPTPPPLPFQVSGVEWRAGEPFLSVRPNDRPTLAETRLLGLGEHAYGWQLDAIEANTAVVHLGSDVRRLTWPTR
ncbi:P-loop NTPase family protein [Collimonas silvisoli]|uniref:hypothetical protein n=1 Tax=Collimonas silvisoli TaxID=2825884 RepID=UPI001B8B3841|nr:hypothetical protein [Collimonas silvisoli]